MTDRDARVARLLIVVIFLGIFTLCIAMGLRSVALQALQQEAIDHGYAEYNSETGEWQWKDEAEETE